MIKTALFALVTAALAFLPVDGSAMALHQDLATSHLRCGVLGKYDISVPFAFRKVTTDMEKINPVSVCESKLKRLQIKVDFDHIQPVSTGSWERKPPAGYDLIVEPSTPGKSIKTRDMIRKLYSRENYEQGNGFPSQAPERRNGLVFIKGARSADESTRNDFYLKSDKHGDLEYMIHCVIGFQEQGRCSMGFSPSDLDLNLVVNIHSSELKNYRRIAHAAKIIVHSLIKAEDEDEAFKPSSIHDVDVYDAATTSHRVNDQAKRVMGDIPVTDVSVASRSVTEG